MGSETLIASGIMGGSSLLGGLMGGGGKGGSSGGGGNVTIAPSPYETQMAQMAQEYYQKTSPLRDVFLQDYMGFMRPGGTSYSSYYAPTSYAGGTSSGGYTGTGAATGAVPSQGDIYKTLFSSTFGGTNVQGLKNLGLTDAEVASIVNNYSAAGGLVPGSIGQLDTGAQQWLTNKAQEIRSNMLSNQIATAQQAQATQTGTPGQGGQTSFASGAYNPYALPAYQPLYQLARQGLESQYGPAREAILASTPRGGALAESLANLEMGRAQQAGSLPATIAAPLIEDIVNKAYGVAFNAPQTSLAGLSGASTGYAGRYGSTLASNTAANQLSALQSASTAKGLGSLAALGLGGLGSKGGGSFKGAGATAGFS